MKTTKKYTICHWPVLIGLLILGAMQMMAVDYKSTYRGIQSQPVYGIATTAIAPTATFQSTSAYSEQWTTEQSSMLNADGSVNAGAYLSSGPNRAKKDGPGSGPGGGSGSSPGTPGGQLDPTKQQPLGDVLLPLTLLACAYAIYKVSRRRKEA